MHLALELSMKLKHFLIPVIPTVILLCVATFFIGRDTAPNGIQAEDLVEAGVNNCINGFVVRFTALDADSLPFFTAQEREELTKIAERCNEPAVLESLKHQYPALYHKMIGLGIIYELDD
jgi:hypothetical protein